MIIRFAHKFDIFCRFVTADKAVGAKGFQATWTEIKEGTLSYKLKSRNANRNRKLKKIMLITVRGYTVTGQFLP